MKNFRVLFLSVLLTSNVSFAGLPKVLPKKSVTIYNSPNMPPAERSPASPPVVVKPKTLPSAAPVDKKKVEPSTTKAPTKKISAPRIKHYAISVAAGGLTNYTQLGAQFEYRFNNFGLGAYYANSNIRNIDNSFKVKGLEYGIIAHYHFMPANYTQNHQYVFDPGAYAAIGQSKFTSDAQSNLPTYIMQEAGLDTGFTVLPSAGISGYFKMGLHYLYHSSVGSQYMGSSTSFGLKWSF